MATESNPLIPDSPYSGQALRPGEIRLLTIISIGEHFELRTERYPINTDVEFDAVSYVWGTAPASISVKCNGSPLLITPTAREMLEHLHLSRPDPIRRLWIDAICIDQQNTDEKAIQVPLMCSIYSLATLVVAWFGPSTPQSDIFISGFSKVSSLSSIQHAIKTEDFDSKFQKDPEWPTDDDPFWTGMVHLLIGEWFTRLWTFQEVVLSRRAVILCGDSSLDMDEFLDFIVVGRYRLFCFPFPLPDHTSGVKPHWNECRSLRIYHRKRSTSGEGLDAKAVPLLLDNVRHRQMKEQVDRIWAVFGLFHPHLQDQLASLVDYSDTARQEHWRTFAGCLKIVVRESASFDLLEFSGQSGPRNGHLPSWCPNFIDDTVQRGYIFGMWNREINKQRNVVQTLLIAEDDKKAYERWSSIEYHHKKDISTTKSDYTLRVRGFLVDTIVEVVQDMHLIDVRDGIENFDSYGPGIENPIIVATVNWESQSLDLARRVYHGENGSDEDVPPEYIMALCTDCRINENCDEAYRNAISSLTTVDWHASNKLEPRQLSQESHFWGHLTSMAGHPSFSTKGGRFGVATPGCKPGDRVCMFYGGHPLYIMRWPTTDANTDAEHDKLPAEFVGTAFIPHLMEPHQSEAARLAPDEIFIIG